MGVITDFLGKIFNKDAAQGNIITENLANEIFLKELAINTAINIIAKLMCNCEIKTYIENKQVKGHNYYLFNIEPNQNQNAIEFYFDWIQKLIYKNECLIVMVNDRLYVAESYDTYDRALTETYFKNVTINDYTLTNKTFYASDVLFLKLNNEKIRQLIDGLYVSYGKLINSAMNSYKKSRSVRGTYKMSSSWKQLYKDQEELQKIIREKFKTYFSSDNAVLPIEEGFDYKEAGENTKNITSSTDIKELLEEVFSIVSIAFNIPKGIMKGDIADNKELLNLLLTLTVKPYAKLYQTEINRKFYGEKEYIKGNMVKADTKKIKYIDIFEVAGSADVLTRIGFSHNDILGYLEEDYIDEEWANEHYVTKNYASVHESNLKEGGKKKSENSTKTKSSSK